MDKWFSDKLIDAFIEIGKAIQPEWCSQIFTIRKKGRIEEGKNG